jgi:hypothetical protein
VVKGQRGGGTPSKKRKRKDIERERAPVSLRFISVYLLAIRSWIVERKL